MSDPIIKLKGLSDFQKVLFLKRSVKDLLKIIHRHKSIIDKLEKENEKLRCTATESAKVKNLKNQLRQITEANIRNKERRKIAAATKKKPEDMLLNIAREIKFSSPKKGTSKDRADQYETLVHNITVIIKSYFTNGN